MVIGTASLRLAHDSERTGGARSKDHEKHFGTDSGPTKFKQSNYCAELLEPVPVRCHRTAGLQARLMSGPGGPRSFLTRVYSIGICSSVRAIRKQSSSLSSSSCCSAAEADTMDT